ncbi:MAG: hypothetical protein HW405_524 [Candidatus Berkelbacteria bacterium]|nr:hypothetical protein [Candidatus Berkelbacteria bacterium]
MITKMVSHILSKPYLAEEIRESARNLCRIPDRTTLPSKQLIGILTDFASRVIDIALRSEIIQPPTDQPYWRPQLNLEVIRFLKGNGIDDLIDGFCNKIDASCPFVSVDRHKITIELRFTAVNAAETAIMVVYDLDPRLLYWQDKDKSFARAMYMAQTLGADFLLVIEPKDPSRDQSSDVA